MGLATLRLAAVIAVLFGVATVASGGNVLFGGGAQTAGNYVPFIVWFNFLAGFFYVAAGVGLWRRERWATWLAPRAARPDRRAGALSGRDPCGRAGCARRLTWVKGRRHMPV
jgi:hypothetical protein